MSKLNGLILTSDSGLRQDLEHVLLTINGFELFRCTQAELGESELANLLEVYHPDVVFLDTGNLRRALLVAAFIRDHAPRTQIAAIASRQDSDAVLSLMRTGVREYFAAPFTAEEIREALSRMNRLVRETPQSGRRGRAFAFVPAKPGSGASTICVNLAFALAEAEQKRVGLLDFDFQHGSVDFLLQLPVGYSVQDALIHTGEMEPSLWRRLVTRHGKLDVLRAGMPSRTLAADAPGLLLFARKQYDSLFIDFSGEMDEASVAALRLCGSIFLVHTSEMTTLHQTRRKLAEFSKVGLLDRVHLIANRVDARGGLKLRDLEGCLGRPTSASLPNDYTSLQQAIRNGSSVVKEGVLSERFPGLLSTLFSGQPPAPPSPKSFLKRLGLTRKAA